LGKEARQLVDAAADDVVELARPEGDEDLSRAQAQPRRHVVRDLEKDRRLADVEDELQIAGDAQLQEDISMVGAKFELLLADRPIEQEIDEQLHAEAALSAC